VSAQLINGNLWPKPRVTTVFPPGGKIGSTVEVTVTGTEIEQHEALIFSHPGIKAVVWMPPPPKEDPKADPKKDPKAKPPEMKKDPPGPPKFTVTIDKTVPPGIYDVRLVTKLGVSNPRAFQVGELEEVLEKEPNNDVDVAQKVELNSTISGVVSAPTDVDYYMFQGKKGQRVVISCSTWSIDSKLQAELRVFDADQRQLAQVRPNYGSDSVTDVILAADGLVFIRLNQFTYDQGNAEFFYRLTISTGPWIDAVFPAAVEPGKTTSVTVYGRNLPGGKLDADAVVDGKVLEKATVNITVPTDPQALVRVESTGLISPNQGLLDGFGFTLKTPAGQSNPIFLTYARSPLILQNDKNHTPETAQEVKTPCEVAGQIKKSRDRDWYAFDAKKGDVLMIDLCSERLGAPTDLYYSVHNLAGKQDITLQDDNPESLSTKSFMTLSRDPSPFRFVAPADGKFHIQVASHSSGSLPDPRQLYRLRIAPETPDFRLVVLAAEDYRPDTTLLGQGGVENYLVFAQRNDGFKGEITLEMDGLPPGVTCPPQTLGGNQKSGLLVVIAADNAAPFTGIVKVKGTAIINGQKVIREARSASVVAATPAQQNIPTATRMDRGVVLAVRSKAPGKVVVEKDKIAISLGDKLEVPIKLIRHDPNFKANFQITPAPGEFPTGVAFAPLTFAPGKDEQNASITVAANAVPGTYNLVFRGFASIAHADAKGKAVNTILPSTPLQITILPKQVATLTVSDANVALKAGGEKEVIVKVARLFDYADAFKIQLVMPPEMKGVAAQDVTIAPGQTDAKLVLKIASDAQPGPRANLTIRATAIVNGNVTLTHETKLNVNVTK